MGSGSRSSGQGDEAVGEMVPISGLKAQEFVAKFIKKAADDEDPMDEALVMQAVAERMDYLGYNEDEIAEQVSKLRTLRESRILGEHKRQFLEVGSEWEEGVEEDLDDEGSKAEGSALDDLEQIEEEEVSDVEDAAAVRVPLGHYVISVVGRSRRKMLHRVGECFRKPGEHDSVFEHVGSEPPEASRFHRACKVCFPKGGEPIECSDGSQSGDEDVSSSDSSSPGTPGNEEVKHKEEEWQRMRAALQARSIVALV